MIKGITGSEHIKVGDNSYTTLYVDMNKPLAGTVRYNGNNRELEVFDGYHWLAITNNYVSIDLNPTIATVIQWAKEKMDEESMYKKLAAEHPVINSALENFKRSEEQLKTTIILATENDSTTTI